MVREQSRKQIEREQNFYVQKKTFFEKHIVEANLIDHYHSLIEVYGYMWSDIYEWAKTGKIQVERKRIFIPENEFLSKIREKGYAYLAFCQEA